MRVLLVKKKDNKYIAADEIASVLLNHLIGKEVFYEAQREDVVALAKMHNFDLKTQLYGYCPLCETLHGQAEECK